MQGAGRRAAGPGRDFGGPPDRPGPSSAALLACHCWASGTAGIQTDDGTPAPSHWPPPPPPQLDRRCRRRPPLPARLPARLPACRAFTPATVRCSSSAAGDGASSSGSSSGEQASDTVFKGFSPRPEQQPTAADALQNTLAGALRAGRRAVLKLPARTACTHAAGVLPPPCSPALLPPPSPHGAHKQHHSLLTVPMPCCVCPQPPAARWGAPPPPTTSSWTPPPTRRSGGSWTCRWVAGRWRLAKGWLPGGCSGARAGGAPLRSLKQPSLPIPLRRRPPPR